jgi:ankyrin repeat protein
MTALHIAAHNGNITLAKHLLKAGAGIKLKNARSETPFHTALKKHQADFMDYLLENGASVGDEGKSAVWMEVVGWNSVRIRHILRRAFKQAYDSQDRK